MLDLLDQLNQDAENEVKQAQNLIADIKERKFKRVEKLSGLEMKRGGMGGGQKEDRDELMEELEMEERKQDNR